MTFQGNGVVALWKDNLTLGIIIAFAMLMNMVAAGVSGVFIPLLLKRFNIDPALAGSVILTTITDIVGIFAFLGTDTYFIDNKKQILPNSPFFQVINCK